jgi:hypothetical protein
MTDHRFALGQTVRLTHGCVFDPDRSAKYRVTRLLPFDGKELRYCLEQDEFLFSRLAMERELIGVIPWCGEFNDKSDNPRVCRLS